jgi:hypothetical protein
VRLPNRPSHSDDTDDDTNCFEKNATHWIKMRLSESVDRCQSKKLSRDRTAC